LGRFTATGPGKTSRVVEYFGQKQSLTQLKTRPVPSALTVIGRIFGLTVAE